MADDPIRIIAEQAEKAGDAVAQIGRKGIDFNTLPAFNTNSLEIGNFRIIESQQNIAGIIGIWGNPDYGEWGSSFWGEIGSPFNTIAIYNDHTYFPEGFWNTRFINTGSTTATVDTGSETVTF